jgi:cyclohexyl-isocyanide hydratase
MTGPSAAPRIVIPVYDRVDLLDVAGVHEMLSWAGIATDLVAAEPGLVATRAGFSFEVTNRFADAPGPYAALWVPGGDPASLAAIIARPKGPYLSYVADQAKTARWVCSVCNGALLLAATGALDGYAATSHWGAIPCLMRFPRVKVADGYPRFVLDRNRLTGGGISSGLDAALKLIELLTDTATAEAAQQATQYYPRPPVSSEIPHTLTCDIAGLA